MTETPFPPFPLDTLAPDENDAAGAASPDADAIEDADAETVAVPATMTAALSFLRHARHNLAKRTQALDRLEKDWEVEQKRYSAFFNTALDGYFVTDPVGIIRDASRVAASLLHIPPPQLPGKPLINFFALEDRPNLRRSLISLRSDASGSDASGSDASGSDASGSDASGSDARQITEFVQVMPRHAPVFEALLRITPITNRRTGELEGLHWLLCDISKRVRAETERYRLLVDAVEDYAVFLMDDAGCITSWNRGAEKAFGWRERDVLGKPYSFLFPPENVEMAETELASARDTGRFPEEGWMVGRDKIPFWTHGVLLALPSGGGGAESHRAGFAKILRDMTDKRREAEDLRLREARLSLALQAAHAASWEWNIETGEIIWSPELFSLLGVSFQTESPSYDLWLRTIHPGSRDEARQRIAESLQTNTPLSLEYRPAPDLHSTAEWVLTLGQPLANADGRVVSMVGVVQDISDRKNAEAELELRVQERTRELAQANVRLVKETKARSELMQKIVTAQEDERRRISRELHDTMGQHLTAFSLSLRVLEDTYPPISSGKPILTRLRHISDELSRDLHQMAMDLRPTALDDLGIANALQSYVENWKERVGIKADFGATGFEHANGSKSCGVSLPAVVETTLYRIAQEALNNIARHSGATRADITLSCHDDMVVMVIEDNGRGFDAERILSRDAAERSGDAPPAPASSGRKNGSRSRGKQKTAAAKQAVQQNETVRPQPSGRLGLMGMAERAQTIGGTFTLESEPGGGGTSIFVRVPLGTGS